MNIFHGSIVTCDSQNQVFRYLVEDNGHIAHIGNELPPEFSRGSSIIELGQKALLPSFADGHLHFSNWALVATMFFDPREAADFAEMGGMIAEASRRDRESKILAGFGLSQHSLKERRLPTREEMDSFEGQRPVYLFCYDGHAAVINSRMLELFPDTIRQTHGFDGAAGQVLHEAYFAATDFVTNVVPPLKLVKSIINGYDLLAGYGIGLIHPVEGIGFPRDLDVTLVSFIAKAQSKKNNFNTRLFFQTMEIDKVLKRSLPRIGGCFATALDGCFGRCDAALNAPYSNDSDNRGILFYPDEEVIEFTKRANRAGLQIEFHTIGDAAIDQALRALEAALEDFPRDDHRHTLIHACLASPRNLETCAKLGIGITLQPGLLTNPLEPPEYLEEILGNRARTNSPLRSMVDLGIHVSGGSDAPVIPPDPIAGIYGACNHPYDPAQSLTIPEALRMYTYEAAWMGFDEQDRGTLEQGKIADLVILNRNPLGMKAEDLRDLKVEQMYLSGKLYQPGLGVLGAVWNSLTAGKKVRI
jgi:predicted amidohydrolase YtcJ